MTPDERLLKAAHHGDYEAAALALWDGADPNAKAPQSKHTSGWRPLHFAAMTSRGYPDDVLRLLLILGADPNLENADHQTPLQLVKSKRVSMTGVLENMIVNYGQTPGDKANLHEVEAAKLPPHEATAELFEASEHGTAATVRSLLKAGANMDARNERRQTPGMVAALRGDIDVLTQFELAELANPRRPRSVSEPAKTYVDDETVRKKKRGPKEHGG